jgi:hypothetical protein
MNNFYKQRAQSYWKSTKYRRIKRIQHVSSQVSKQSRDRQLSVDSSNIPVEAESFEDLKQESKFFIVTPSDTQTEAVLLQGQDVGNCCYCNQEFLMCNLLSCQNCSVLWCKKDYVEQFNQNCSLCKRSMCKKCLFLCEYAADEKIHLNGQVEHYICNNPETCYNPDTRSCIQCVEENLVAAPPLYGGKFPNSVVIKSFQV